MISMSKKAALTLAAIMLLPSINAQANEQNPNNAIAQASQSTTIGLKEFRDLRDVSTLNLCYSLAQKVEYKTAAAVSLLAMINLIKERYNSKVIGMPSNAKTAKGLQNWVAGTLLVKTSLVCPKLMPESELEIANRIKAASKKSTK